MLEHRDAARERFELTVLRAGPALGEDQCAAGADARAGERGHSGEHDHLLVRVVAASHRSYVPRVAAV